MTQKSKLFLLDPYSVVRSGMRLLLAEEPSLVCVGEAAGCREAMPLINQTQPDLVVMELIYPQEDGLEFVQRLRVQHPRCQVLIFTDSVDEAWICRAIYAGAIGYLTKQSSGPEIVRAVRAVAQGEPALQAVAQRVLIQLALGAPSLLSALTAREQEILRLITLGKRNRDIANQLCLTEGTVKGYVSTILNKLEVDDRTQAAMFAVKHRLVPKL